MVNEILLADDDSALRKLVAPSVEKEAVVNLWMEPAYSPAIKSALTPIRAGMKCIWGFDGSSLDGMQCRLYSVTTPFPGNKFDDADVECFRFKLKKVVENNEKLKAILQKYLEERWTIERIEKFCKPERRVVQPFQDLLQTRTFTLEGKLYPALKTELGEVSWYCGVDDNVPDLYSISVSRKTAVHGLKRPDRWNLEVNFPGFSSFSDDEFIMHLVNATLSECAHNYDRVHRGNVKVDLHAQAYKVTKEQLIRDQEGRVKAFSCILNNGSNLVAELEQNLSIKSISIDGKPHKEWTQAVAEASRNIDTLNRKDEDQENAIREEFQQRK